MQLDWITVTAQLVNFLILVYLLKRLLYAPVLSAVERRQARIAAQLNEAAQRESHAAEVEQNFRRRLEEMEQTRTHALAQIERDVATERSERMTALREELASTRGHLHQALERERERFVKALSTESTQLTVELARRTLGDLADESLENLVVRRFLARVQSLDAEHRELIRSALGPIRIHTTFDLDDASRDRVRTALRTILSVERAIDFQRAPTLVCGVELIAGHTRVGWNMRSHLEQLERKANDALSRSADAFKGGEPGHRETH